MAPAPAPPRRALSIRQPYAELILRGIKTIEYRTRPVRPPLIGVPFYIYASKKWGGVTLPLPWGVGEGQGEGAHDRQGPNGHALTPNPSPKGRGELPTGVIVGTATITRCVRDNGHYEWHLSNVERLDPPLRPTGHPQPVWFNPFPEQRKAA